MGRAALILWLCASLAIPAAIVVSPRAAHAAADASAKVKARLKKGRKLYEEQEYRKAIRELSPVSRDPAATRAQKLEANELLGLCWFILGDEASAREAFEDLLAIDAGYELRDDADSPKLRAFFEHVKRDYVPNASGQRATIEHAAPEAAVAGRRIELAAEITSGEDAVKDIVVAWRRRGVLEYQTVALRRVKDAKWRARFTPPADTAGYVLEYYLEARDLAGNAIARNGGPETPLSLPVKGAASEKSSWYRKWYVIAGAGVVLVGTAALVGVAATGQTAPQGTLSPGSVNLGN